MIQTVEAIIDKDGQVHLLQPVQGSGQHRAIVTILYDKPEIGEQATTLLDGLAAENRQHPDENKAADDAGKWEQRRKDVASVRAFQAKMGQKYGVQPDSTPIIREARDNLRA